MIVGKNNTLITAWGVPLERGLEFNLKALEEAAALHPNHRQAFFLEFLFKYGEEFIRRMDEGFFDDEEEVLSEAS